MRRLFLPLALLALTGTLVAQTPLRPMPITEASKFHSKVYWTTMTQDGALTHLKGARFEFANGLLIMADDVVLQVGMSTAQFSGNAQLTTLAAEAAAPTVSVGPIAAPIDSRLGWSSQTIDGDTGRMKDFVVEMKNLGVTITAEEAMYQKGQRAIQLSGNVQMTVK